jgi:DNA-binding transcriptional ArsR family regulator
VDDDQLSRVFAALADPTRRDMVARLAVGDATVGELADPYDVSVQAVSKHIKVLTDAGLVSQRRDGQRRPCHLEEMRGDERSTNHRNRQQGAAS